METITAPAVLTGYALSQKDNGPNSGWMYTVNGKHPGVGLDAYKFSSNEDIIKTHTAVVVWHYVNDWVYEQSDSAGTMGDDSTWNKWLDAPDREPTAVPVSSVALDKKEASVLVGDTLTLMATVLPTYALDKSVTWLSSDTSVATVKNGVVTGVKAGTATITAIAGEGSATCKVTVTAEKIAVESITLDKSEVTITEDETIILTATVSPADATDKTVSWTSSDTSVATVKGGIVTGVSAGTATITAKAGGKTATCTVTVEAAEIAVTRVTLDKNEASVAEGKTVTLTATVYPTNATDKTVRTRWRPSSPTSNPPLPTRSSVRREANGPCLP